MSIGTPNPIALQNLLSELQKFVEAKYGVQTPKRMRVNKPVKVVSQPLDDKKKLLAEYKELIARADALRAKMEMIP